MKIKNALVAFFGRNSKVDMEYELYHINLRRILIFSFICILASLVNIAMFLADKEHQSPIELLWRNGILKVHTILILVMLFFIIASYALINCKNRMVKLEKILITLAVAVAVGAGIIITGIDQLVTDNITPFLIACMAVAVIILMEPRFALLLNLTAYILFIVMMKLVQTDSIIYLTNKANSITAVAISFCTSLLLWGHYLEHYNQKQFIARQNGILEAKNQELSESNDIKDKLISIITHDVRQPLANALSLTEIMAEVEPMDADFHGIVLHVREQMIKSFHMTDNLLNWCKHQKDGFNYIPVLMNLQEVIAESIQISKIRTDSKEIHISNEIDSNTELIVLADRDMIGMVIRNILYNAVKYTKRGDIIHIRGNQSGGEIIIEVEDKGIGMDRQRLEEIFDSKNIITSIEGTEGEQGTGIGLQICKEMMFKNKGRIWATSEPGSGSIFYIALPAESKH
ncbi:MAG TPA: HAMP domain-containing histidine kinase [Clostridiales bacterium]|nr:HAMP domain-containing histidine kinase [Clostridiales bacterium]